MFEECFGMGPFIFRVNENGSGPQLLTQVCLERGWKEYNPDPNETWNLWWKTSGFPESHQKNLYAWQYLNHIPKGSTICRKDNLVRYLRCMRRVYGSICDFSPCGFNLPLEYTKLAAECSRGKLQGCGDKQDTKISDEKLIWICKPVAQSQGKGIFLFKKLTELNYDTNAVVQRYIEKPLLIGGYKFDLRLYVCVPSYHPVTVYMYREGLARFGTEKFCLSDLRNPFRHLTNSSINKLGPGYAEMKDRVGSGCKWTLRQLRRYFQQGGISDWLLWQRITSLVILTVLSHVQQIPPTVNCFEFFGFDVLIDSSMRPWLLEVNLSPALSNDCDADRMVKKPMLHDMFDLLGLPLYNTGLSVFDLWLDDSNENTRNETVDQISISIKSTVSVLNAAGRWRRKHRKMSARQSSRSSSAVRPKIRATSVAHSSQKTYLNLPKVEVDAHNLGSSICYNVPTVKHSDNDFKKPKQRTWGNGKNWNFPSAREGGWIRIWPMTTEEKIDKNNNQSSNQAGSNGSIKHMVNKVIKFNKAAKDLIKKHCSSSESQLCEFLQEEMEMSGDVWIPPI